VAVFLASGLAASVHAAVAVFGVLGFGVSILAHELAHALIARRSSIQTRSIELWALGGMARLDRDAPTPRSEAAIAVAGPLTSLVLGTLMLGVWFGLPTDGMVGDFGRVAGWLAVVNLGLGFFNLLPGAPLDGGRILRAIRWAQHGDRYRAGRESGTAGVVLGWLVAGVGLWLLLRGYGTVTVLLVGVFIAINARVEIASAALHERVAGIRVGDLTWFGVATVDQWDDVATMLRDRRRLGGADAAAVLNDAGIVIGVVLLEAADAVAAEQRFDTFAADLMTPIAEVPRTQTTDDLADSLTGLNPRHPILTVWDGDLLVGVVPPRRLREALGV
jgi:Zn-dependent protease